MISYRILFLFLYFLFFALLLPPLLPMLHLLFFAPFLAYLFYQQEQIPCLWFSLLCGLCIDLLSSQTRLGTYALNYCLTTLILYRYKKHFFEDSLSTIPLMTGFFTFTSILIQIVLLYGLRLGFHVHLTWSWFKEDLLGTMIVNMLYAGISFTLPSLCFHKKTPRRSTILISPR